MERNSHHVLSTSVLTFMLASNCQNEIIFSICHSSEAASTESNRILFRNGLSNEGGQRQKVFYEKKKWNKTNKRIIEMDIKKHSLSVCISNLMEIQWKCQKDKEPRHTHTYTQKKRRNIFCVQMRNDESEKCARKRYYKSVQKGRVTIYLC